MRNGAILLTGLVVLGVCGSIAALAARESDDAFLARQQNGVTVHERTVAAAVEQPREPVPGGDGARAVRAECLREGQRPPRWFCLVEYASGNFVEYAVDVDPTGRFSGVDETGRLRISGCCARPGG